MRTQTISVGIYVRLSRDDERAGESLSIENQKAFLEKYANDIGWHDTTVYADDGWSGVNFDRPAMKDLLRDVQNGKINIILVKDLSRFGRNQAKFTEIVDELLPAYKCRLIAVNDGVDTLNSDNDIMPFKNLFNEFFCRDLSRKVKTGKLMSAQKGKFSGAYAPLGYMKNPYNTNELIIDEGVADLIRRIFRMRCEGLSYLKISSILTEERVPTPRDYYYAVRNKENPRRVSHSWSDISVSEILKNEVYIGNMVSLKWGNFSYKNKKQLPKPKDEWVRIPQTHAPIIDAETWETVQKLREKNAVFRETNGGTPALFSGLLRCADCGFNMKQTKYANRQKDAAEPYKVQYICGTYSKSGLAGCAAHRIHEENLIRLVKEDILAHAERILFDDETVINELMVRKDKDSLDEKTVVEKELRLANNRLSDLERLISSLYEDKVSGDVSKDMYAHLMHKYEQERIEKAVLIAELSERVQNAEETECDISRWVSLIKSYMNVEEIDRTILLQLIDYIVVGEKCEINGEIQQEVTIHYNFVGTV